MPYLVLTKSHPDGLSSLFLENRLQAVSLHIHERLTGPRCNWDGKGRLVNRFTRQT
ncbi:hypothetical protein PENANT_c008G06920 [Penicillium antarcticum]|uniref:Uncharacterized protein n=1 Tax=Penicillium antarcticum TaxID=416450 RepID=A0A1V6QA09_9EURO|nr:hypothetical protein PENANT_c008G06920 [Penicillium antarcticum]